jgi:hypothetical protein
MNYQHRPREAAVADHVDDCDDDKGHCHFLLPALNTHLRIAKIHWGSWQL